MPAVAARGRWVWTLASVVTAVVLAVFGSRLLTSFGSAWQGPAPVHVVPQRITVPQAVTSVTVQSYGMPVRVTGGPISRVQVSAVKTYDPQDGPPPAVAESRSGGNLAIGDPACQFADCGVSFTLTVPADVTVTVESDGGRVAVTGVASATVDSDGGPVQATRIGGPLTVSTDGTALRVDGVSGPVRADTDGGPVTAAGVSSADCVITTAGGPARVAFSAPPQQVTVSTDGGPAILTVPGGPYALTADSDGGPESVRIPTAAGALRSIAVSSDGGSLTVHP